MNTKAMKDYTLYYYIPWPDSQNWLEQKQAIEDGDIVIDARFQNSCFVAKNLYDYINGL